MDPKRQREIARQGGRAAHRLGLAHEFTPEEARSARAKSLAARALASAVPVPPEPQPQPE
jgi:enoyl-CoA hydratase/carnithine racemase